MILEILEAHREIISGYEIRLFQTTPITYRYQIEVYFIDGSALHAREYLFEDGRAKYVYHYQDETAKLIIRWDNVPHHKEIATFPCHCHQKSDTQVCPSEPMTLAKVLQAIRDGYFLSGNP